MFFQIFVFFSLFIYVHNYEFNEIGSVLYLKTNQKVFIFEQKQQADFYIINPCVNKFFEGIDQSLCLEKFSSFKNSLRTKCNETDEISSLTSDLDYIGVWNYGGIIKSSPSSLETLVDTLKKKFKNERTSRLFLSDVENLIFNNLSQKVFSLLRNLGKNIISITNKNDIIEDLFEEDIKFLNCLMKTSKTDLKSDLHISIEFKGYRKSFFSTYLIHHFNSYNDNCRIKYNLPKAILLSFDKKQFCEISNTFSREELIMIPECLFNRNLTKKTSEYLSPFHYHEKPVILKLKDQFIVYCPLKNIFVNNQNLICPDSPFSLPLDTKIDLALFDHSIDETFKDNELDQNLFFFEKLFQDLNRNSIESCKKENFFNFLELKFLISVTLIFILTIILLASCKLINAYNEWKFQVRLIKYKHQLID